MGEKIRKVINPIAETPKDKAFRKKIEDIAGTDRLPGKPVSFTEERYKRELARETERETLANSGKTMNKTGTAHPYGDWKTAPRGTMFKPCVMPPKNSRPHPGHGMIVMHPKHVVKDLGTQNERRTLSFFPNEHLWLLLRKDDHSKQMLDEWVTNYLFFAGVEATIDEKHKAIDDLQWAADFIAKAFHGGSALKVIGPSDCGKIVGMEN